MNGRETGVASAALDLAARDWPVFPTNGKVPRTVCGLKDATTNEQAISNWYRLWPDAGIGVRTGGGLVVLDVDGDQGADSLHALEIAHGELPCTVSVTTGGGGMHYWFRKNVPVRNSARRLGRGLDIRGDGGYVIAPPSAHPSGRRYEWDNHPDDVPLAPLPQWIIDRLWLKPDGVMRRQGTATWLGIVRDGLGEGERNDGHARLVGHLLAKDVNAHLVLELAHAVNARFRPPLDTGEVDRIANSIARCELTKRRGRR
jgi:Bifunctional DNA primase/polymerase, N-terminal/Primase C terminal 1 (PriCT-1)